VFTDRTSVKSWLDWIFQVTNKDWRQSVFCSDIALSFFVSKQEGKLWGDVSGVGC
jgi:hypothetical protein